MRVLFSDQLKEPNPNLFEVVEHSRQPLYTNSDGPIQTNKFWSNVVLPNMEPIFSLPYALKINSSTGLLISHCNCKVFGGGTSQKRQYYFNPFHENISFSSKTWKKQYDIKVESHDIFSVEISLWTMDQSLTFPIVQGMVYVTAKYDNLTPFLHTQHHIVQVNGTSTSNRKFPFQLTSNSFCIELNNGQTWMLYCITQEITFQCTSSSMEGMQPITGTLRLTLLPDPSQLALKQLLKKHAQVYPIGCDLEWESQYPQYQENQEMEKKGKYFFQWKTQNDQLPLLHYALPHHLDTVKGITLTNLCLSSPTKGIMQGCIGNTWEFNENHLNSISWLPPRAPSLDMLPIIHEQFFKDFDELKQQDFQPWNNPSNYFAGKELYKVAQLGLVAHSLQQHHERDCIMHILEHSLQYFIDGKNANPLKYDKVWKGILGSNGLFSGDPHADFGNSLYNDHHFHWSYFIHTAAIIRHFNKHWGSQNEEWVNTLIRDVNNTSPKDIYFPCFRSFDWFSGHSWAHGITPFADGKNEESTSESIHFYYGIKLWGMAIENQHLSSLGDLMLAVHRRSIQKYFLIMDDSNIHPLQFIPNKVTGILFENKCDYTTWFGREIEKIHGIQMIPATPITEYTRPIRFIVEEWRLLQDVSPCLTNGWKSILYMNYASIDKETAFQELLHAPLDDGVCRTWALFYASTRKSHQEEVCESFTS